jgi:hypothetical protein
MTKFCILWQKNLSLLPEDPVKLTQLYISQLEMVKAELKSGKITDWGQFCNGANGYAIAEGNEADIFPALMKWMPYIEFDVKPVLNADQTLEAIKKVVAQSKTK